MSARNEVLNRIRAALADAPAAPPVPREYRLLSNVSQDQRVEQLVDRLVDYKANVFQCTAAELPATLAALLADVAHVVVPSGLEESWLRGVNEAEISVDSDDHRLSVAELDSMDAVVTAAAVAVSETGTIMLDGSPTQGRRAISLVPDRHICVLMAADVVEVLPEAIARLTPTAPQTWISGPSATSDIELERVEGVHGPRTLDVVIVS